MSTQHSTANGVLMPPYGNSENTPKFVWESTPGLEHHCPVCATPNSHSSVNTFCLGDHVMPCPKYHQTLFWPNKTSECDACNRSREEHYKRHKDIVASLRELERLGVRVFPPPPPSTNAGKAGALEANGACVPMSRSQKKKAKKQQKALARGSTVNSTPYADIHRVAKAFHPDPLDQQEGFEEDHIEVDDSNFPDNLLRDSLDYAWYRRSLSQGRVVPPKIDEEVAAALKRLGVDVSPAGLKKFTKAQRSVVNRLLGLARADLHALWNEEVETAKRRGGFLRYASIKALERMHDTRMETLERLKRQGRAGEVGQVAPDVHPEEEDGQQGEAVKNEEADQREEAVENAAADQQEEAVQKKADAVDAEEIDAPTQEQVRSDSETPEAKVSGSGINDTSMEDPAMEPSKLGQSDDTLLKTAIGIPLPPPTLEEHRDWDVQVNKANFRRIVENTYIPPARTTLKARDFFKAGVYNLHNHDIWAQPRDTPLERLVDPEKAYVMISNHHIDPKRPRYDDWKAFMTDMKMPIHRPYVTVPIMPDGVFSTHVDVGAPAKASSSRLVVPMGEDVYMAEEQLIDEAMKALLKGAAGCPPGHVAMLMSNHIVPFVFDATQPAPDFLVEQFTRGDGFWAEQCWQYHLVGSMNQRNLMLRDGLLRKKDLGMATAEDAAQIEQLERPLNNNDLPRGCICGGLHTERMVECENAQCHLSGVPVHARCVDVIYAPAEGEHYFCRKCTNDLVWFAVEEKTWKRIEDAVGDPDKKAPKLGMTSDDLTALLTGVLRLVHSDAGTQAFVDFVEKPFDPVPREKVPVEKIAEQVVSLVEDSKEMGMAKLEARDAYMCIYGVRTLEECARAQDKGEMREGENNLNWGTENLGPNARKLFLSDPVKGAEAVVRWDMAKHL
ncbi:hypothetical protein DBV05_g1986 [Lasiodiplodia theobromae]|uniref:Uncharacterized protein n=1 Tax=Lasiodiplodia theobromae TaxID=45133 RepID=A0A5N5DN68_9PEZI|nr:hypothetical protein DBV05_g1986 [Lasiodiplodia theobromae]